jgi:hypothetical protein
MIFKNHEKKVRFSLTCGLFAPACLENSAINFGVGIHEPWRGRGVDISGFN